MAYLGTPIDTRNQFQSLEGKRFSGDGSTTAFTLDSAPSSTLDIEVFVGNVRQDPNSAYTLSGTTLTFTGAPPSGTNNIYVVHQAKAVGTINPGANTVGITELNVSDGSNGQVLKTDGSGTLSFGTGFDADGAQVFNESGAAVDFRVESDGNVNAFIVDGSANRVGFGIAAPETEMHIQSTSGECELRLTAASTSDARLRFGDTDDTDAGYIGYSRDTGKMTFSSLNSSGAHFQIHNNGFLKIGAGTSIPTDTTFPITINAIKDGNYVEELIIKNTSSQSCFGKRIYIDQYAPDNNSSEFMNFRDTGGERFRVFSDGDVQNHDNSYGSISDERIKQNITDSGSQWDDIKALKVRKYKKKDDVRQYGDKAWEQIGVIAQELEASGMNKLVEESPPTSFDIESDSAFGTLYTESDKDENGNLPPEKNIGDVKEVKANVKGVKYSVLYMKAIKALQEAMTRIETLEAKVKTLEEA